MEELLEPSSTWLPRMYEAESRNSAILSGQNSIIKPSMHLTPMVSYLLTFVEIIEFGRSSTPSGYPLGEGASLGLFLLRYYQI